MGGHAPDGPSLLADAPRCIDSADSAAIPDPVHWAELAEFPRIMVKHRDTAVYANPFHPRTVNILQFQSLRRFCR